ncbi:MAG: hypothetical protein ACP6IS_03810 [Candidatus Asgardarchaeia archaeon]
MRLNIKNLIHFLASHIITYLLSYFTLYAIILFLPYILPPQRLLYLPVLYAVIILIPLISIQVGVALNELIRLRPVPILLIYYFLYDPDEDLPNPELDPIKSEIGLVTLFLLLAGGYIAWPVFFAYGLITTYEVFGKSFVLSPEFIRGYLEQVAFAIPPFLGILLLILILSVFTIERRYISR